MKRSPKLALKNDKASLKQEMINRICGEFLEMPGLGLKREQARRLWQVDDEFCGELLDTLVESRFLCRRSDGRYVRAATAPESIALGGFRREAI
jgi:hypothetical protein